MLLPSPWPFSCTIKNMEFFNNSKTQNDIGISMFIFNMCTPNDRWDNADIGCKPGWDIAVGSPAWHLFWSPFCWSSFEDLGCKYPAFQKPGIKCIKIAFFFSFKYDHWCFRLIFPNPTHLHLCSSSRQIWNLCINAWALPAFVSHAAEDAPAQFFN